ncbi:MAG: hypothetical protein J2P25_07865 [Nocardiopsaceae bacterium]|nr:hypothetical protein [Nocardiopsaceae bacterium]
MSLEDARWAIGPFGLDASRAATYSPERIVLAVVHHMTAATRLADIMPLLESDRRIQAVYTCAPSSMSPGWIGEHLSRLGAMVVPWQQAIRTPFNLAIAASSGQLERLHAPVLQLLHGTGFNKYAKRWNGQGPQAHGRELYGMERAVLVYRGRVIPSAMVIPTRRDVARLRRGCPEAAEVAVVAGDPAFDRLIASLAWRERYRRVLGVQDKTLVAVSSTWGPGSLLQRCPDLPARLVSELPRDSYRVAAVLHPNIWAWSGRRQVRAWLADSMRRGLILVPPEEGWRAVLTAADVVVGDHGSASCYSAAAGRPVLMASFPGEELDPASTSARLGRLAPRLVPGESLGSQLADAAMSWTPSRHRRMRELVTDVPGRSGELIRSLMYRLLNLAEPEETPVMRPVPEPEPLAVLG